MHTVRTAGAPPGMVTDSPRLSLGSLPPHRELLKTLTPISFQQIYNTNVPFHISNPNVLCFHFIDSPSGVISPLNDVHLHSPVSPTGVELFTHLGRKEGTQLCEEERVSSATCLKGRWVLPQRIFTICLTLAPCYEQLSPISFQDYILWPRGERYRKGNVFWLQELPSVKIIFKFYFTLLQCFLAFCWLNNLLVIHSFGCLF